jgi:hypothetical protein
VQWPRGGWRLGPWIVQAKPFLQLGNVARRIESDSRLNGFFVRKLQAQIVPSIGD